MIDEADRLLALSRLLRETPARTAMWESVSPEATVTELPDGAAGTTAAIRAGSWEATRWDAIRVCAALMFDGVAAFGASS
ncbi:hypothetical protein GCM10027591_02830 [Zhihengliuella somnathii]